MGALLKLSPGRLLVLVVVGLAWLAYRIHPRLGTKPPKDFTGVVIHGVAVQRIELVLAGVVALLIIAFILAPKRSGPTVGKSKYSG